MPDTEDTPITQAPAAEVKLPRIRYTKGPAQLLLGDLPLKRTEWSGQVSEALAEEATRPGRVQEYGFEAEGYTRPQAEPDDAAPAAARAKRTGRTPATPAKE